MKKIFFILTFINVLFANENSMVMDSVSKKYLDRFVENGIVNHYEVTMSIDMYKKNNQNDSIYNIISIEKLYDFREHIYKVRYFKRKLIEYKVWKESKEEDFIEVDKSAYIDTFMRTPNDFMKNFNKYKKYLFIYKIKNFEKLVDFCNKDKDCINKHIGVNDKINNINYEKIKLD